MGTDPGSLPDWLKSVRAKLDIEQAIHTKDCEENRVCRFCKSHKLRVLNDNGKFGDGYRVTDWVCKECGRVQ